MQIAYPGQANEVSLPVVAKATGNPITSGTVNFYLKDIETGKWFKGSDSSWQSSESLAGAATHESDGHWILSLVSAAWIDIHKYKLYAKESGNLHIPVSETIICSAVYDIATIVSTLFSTTGVTAGGTWTFAKLLKVMTAWAAGKWRDKSGAEGTYEILDPDDGATVIAEITPDTDSPYKQVTIL